MLSYIRKLLLWIKKPRATQRILDVAIKKGYYNNIDTFYSSTYMCIALRRASNDGYISRQEFNNTVHEISNYINEASKYNTLVAVLIDNDLPHEFSDTLAIYKNWANRPTLQKLEK